MPYKILAPANIETQTKTSEISSNKYKILAPVQQTNEKPSVFSIPSMGQALKGLDIDTSGLESTPIPQAIQQLEGAAFSLPAFMQSREAGQAAYKYYQQQRQPQQKEQEKIEPIRAMAQLPIGYGYGAAGAGRMGPVAQAFTIPDIINDIVRRGAIGSFEEIQRDYPERKISKEDYEKAINQFSQKTPTVFNAIKAVGEITGLPLEAKTEVQQKLLQASMILGATRKADKKLNLQEEKDGTSTLPLNELPPPEELVKGVEPQEKFAGPEEWKQQLAKRPPEYETQPPPELSKSSMTATKTAAQLPRSPRGALLPPPQLTRNGRDIGIRPTGQGMERPATFNDQLSRIFTDIPKRQQNPADLGFQFKSKVNERLRTLYDESVQPAYELSDYYLADANGLNERLYRRMRTIVEGVNARNPLLRSPADTMLLNHATAIMDAAGTEGGLIELNAQNLSREIQELNRIQHFEVEQAGDPYARLNELREPLHDAVEDLLIQQVPEGTHSPGLEAWQEARDKYRGFADIANDHNIQNFREINNYDYDNLFDLASKNPDSFRAFQRAMTIYQDREGWELSQIAKKNLVNNIMGDYVKNPKYAFGEDFEKDLRKLHRILTPHEYESLANAFRNRSRMRLVNMKPKIAEKLPTPKTIVKELPFEKTTNEQLYDHTSTVTGLNEVERELLKTPGGKDMVKKVFHARAMETMFSGEKPSYQSMEKALGNRHKREILVKTLGKGQVENLDVAIRTKDALIDELSKVPTQNKFSVKKALKSSLKLKTIKAGIKLFEWEAGPIAEVFADALIKGFENEVQTKNLSKEMRQMIKIAKENQ